MKYVNQHADVVAAMVVVLPMLLTAVFTCETWLDAALISTCFWVPLFGLSLIRRRRPLLAAGVNALGFWPVLQISDMSIWRPFCRALVLFSTMKAYDFAKLPQGRLNDLSLAQIYVGSLFQIDIVKRIHVARISECLPCHDFWLDMIETAILIPLGLKSFYFVSSFKSNQYDLYLFPTLLLDGVVMSVRCTLVGIVFGYMIHALRFVYQLVYAPFRIKYTQLSMNRILASTSLAEFWSYRWNRVFHGLFKRTVYQPLLKRGILDPTEAQQITFAVSGVVHVFLLVDIVPNWKARALCLGFFLCHGILLAVERRLFFSEHSPWYASKDGLLENRLFVYASFLVTAPLLVEPVLRQYHL